MRRLEKAIVYTLFLHLEPAAEMHQNQYYLVLRSPLYGSRIVPGKKYILSGGRHLLCGGRHLLYGGRHLIIWRPPLIIWRPPLNYMAAAT